MDKLDEPLDLLVVVTTPFPTPALRLAGGHIGPITTPNRKVLPGMEMNVSEDRET